MPTLIRIGTGLVVGAMLWFAFSDGSWLRMTIFSLWSVGVAYVGLMLAAYLETP
jgi:hypothetical protein